MPLAARTSVAILLVALFCYDFVRPAPAATGDPQLKTDHEWYPGELSCSTFERLFKTQADLYRRVTGREVSTDEDKALASWYWRNLNCWHGEEGQRDCFSGALGGDKGREYWTGLFADGFSLCGTTHAQWCAEMDALLGHCRSRVVGVAGHNSFEVFLTGGEYAKGRWALLDHDVSTVIFAPDGKRLLGLHEIAPQVKSLTDPAFKPERQRGWRVSGLHDDDARGVYTKVGSVEYLAGYAGPPPMVQLRRGETLRRYLQPGLEDGKTFVFWGRNSGMGTVPGPARDRSWVNQPEKMHGSKSGTGAQSGRARYANAVYSYTPDFADGSYKQGVVDEDAEHVTFEFYTPYVIAATPSSQSAWGVYEPGGRNGLVLHGSTDCPVAVSLDQGRSWKQAGRLTDGLDLTDHVKGYQQYLLRFAAGAAAFKQSKLWWRTICQANAATMPHLHDGDNAITFAASGRGLISAGPTAAQAETHIVDGKLGSNNVTLQLTAPRGVKPMRVHAASWQASGSPPAAAAYRIDYSIDGGKNWLPVVEDWKLERRPPEPGDFWSQSFTWAAADVAKAGNSTPVRVRFTNSGGRTYRKVEAHLEYDVPDAGPTDATFAWTAEGHVKRASHTYPAAAPLDDATWHFDAGQKVETLWVEMKSN